MRQGVRWATLFLAAALAGCAALHPVPQSPDPGGVGALAGEANEPAGGAEAPVGHQEGESLSGAGAPADGAAREEAAVARAREALRALREGDVEMLARLAHPEKGIRFSPYAFVRTGSDGDVVLFPE